MSTPAFYQWIAVDVYLKRLNYSSRNLEANMASSDPYKDINTIIKIAFVVALILGSYNLWSFLIAVVIKPYAGRPSGNSIVLS